MMLSRTVEATRERREGTVVRIRERFFFTVSVAMVLFCGMPVTGSAGDVTQTLAKERRIVAAGLGLQNADSSSITVKIYDADSGEVLSNDSYELDIKEEGPATLPQPRERIFAGGVGVGADGLSDFTLRVYDAADGRFLWEGRLNLRGGHEDADTVQVAASVQPHAMVRRVGNRESTEGQPSFLLRAIDSETGQLVWSDRFSTEAGNFRAERISLDARGAAASTPQDIDFRIQMFDEGGRQLLWEDKVTPSDEGIEPASGLGEEELGSIPPMLPERSSAPVPQAI